MNSKSKRYKSIEDEIMELGESKEKTGENFFKKSTFGNGNKS